MSHKSDIIGKRSDFIDRGWPQIVVACCMGGSTMVLFSQAHSDSNSSCLAQTVQLGCATDTQWQQIIIALRSKGTWQAGCY